MPVWDDGGGQSSSLSVGQLSVVPFSDYVSATTEEVTLQSLFDWHGRWAVRTTVKYDRALSRPTLCAAYWLKPVPIPICDIPPDATPMDAVGDGETFDAILDAMVASRELLMRDVSLILDRSTFE